MTGRTELLRFFLDKSKNKFSILSSYFYRKDTLMNRLQDKVAIITGASSGVGKCIAESFAAEGAKVMLFARKENLLTEIVNDIKAKGGEASFLAGSVTDQKAVEEVFKKTVDAYGKVDIVVNDAGIGGYYGAADVPDKECYDLFDTNAMGSTWPCRCGLRAVQGRHGQPRTAGCRRISSGRHPQQCNLPRRHYDAVYLRL